MDDSLIEPAIKRRKHVQVEFSSETPSNQSLSCSTTHEIVFDQDIIERMDKMELQDYTKHLEKRFCVLSKLNRPDSNSKVFLFFSYSFSSFY